MNQGFAEALLKHLIKEKGFTPLADAEGNITINTVVNILAKESLGSLVLLEIIDADEMTAQEIEARLKDNGSKLSVINGGSNNYVFEVFIFKDEPDREKLEVIEAGQVQNVMGKRYLKCITLSLSAQSVKKHFTIPLADFGIEKVMKAYFENGSSEGADVKDISELLEERDRELVIEFRAKTPILSYALIAINIAVFGLITLYGIISGVHYSELLMVYGAKENAKILAGEYWRFITPIFLHADVIHLLVNCYSIYAVGLITEKIFGYGRYAFIYFIAGILGNIASFMFSINPGVGASGAIFGLMGAMLYFGLEKPAQFKAYFSAGIITTIAINLFYGFSRSGIDNFAHLGGLVGGFLAAGIVGQAYKNRWYLNRGIFLVLTLVITASGLLYGFNSKSNEILVKVNQLEELDKAQNWAETEKLCEEILAMQPKNDRVRIQVLWSLIRAEAMSGKYEEGIEHAKELTLVDPANGHYLKGLLYFDTKQYELAKQELLQAKWQGAKYEGIDELIKKADEAMKGAGK